MIETALLRKLSEYSPKQQAAALLLASDRLTRPPKTPREYHSRYLRILDKRGRLVDFKWNKAQQHFHEHRTGRDLVLKARQLGFSTYIQGEIYRYVTTGTHSAMTMAHDDDTTQKLRQMADRFWNNDPSKPERKYANATVTTYPEHDSTMTIATAGGKNKGRGGTYSKFHGSEVAFWPDAKKIVDGAMQGGNPEVVLESTANGAQGFFFECCMEAMDGDSIWTLHFYPWWWDDEYRLPLTDSEVLEYTENELRLVEAQGLDAEQIKWRRYKKRELKETFLQEYPEDPLTCFLTSGNSYFGNIEDYFTAPLDARPVDGHAYRAGLDFGQSDDYTVLIVVDQTTNRMVDMFRENKQSWESLRRGIASKVRKWNNCSVLAEENSIGSVNIEKLVEMGVSVEPFTTSNASKATIMSDLKDALHDEGLRLMDVPALKQEMRNFVSTQLPSGLWRLAADGEGHDDTVIALALAYQRGTWYFA